MPFKLQKRPIERRATLGRFILPGKVQVRDAIQEIAAITEETAASAQQTSSSMEDVASSSVQLVKLGEDLNALIIRFRL
jgi:methyl-accepting chemotaxis protein